MENPDDGIVNQTPIFGFAFGEFGRAFIDNRLQVQLPDGEIKSKRLRPDEFLTITSFANIKIRARMLHLYAEAERRSLLVAGTTGSGKSVALNAMILSLLYKSTAEQVRLIMIDPKMLELSVYDGIPHLLLPVVTDPKKASVALKWAVKEMEQRYRQLAKHSVRNIQRSP